MTNCIYIHIHILPLAVSALTQYLRRLLVFRIVLVLHIPAMPPHCPRCDKVTNGKASEMCTECKDADGTMGEISTDVMSTQDGGGRARSKSPLVNSSERLGKVLKVDILTPLPAC